MVGECHGGGEGAEVCWQSVPWDFSLLVYASHRINIQHAWARVVVGCTQAQLTTNMAYAIDTNKSDLKLLCLTS